MVDRIKELQFQIEELEKKQKNTDEIVKRLEVTENKIQLAQRTDPAIQLGTNLHDLGLVNEKARVYTAGAQSINATTVTKVEFNLKTNDSYDPQNNFDTTTNYNYVVPIDGFYFVTSVVGLTFANADKWFLMLLYINGITRTPVILNRTSVANSGEHHLNISDIIKLTLGDTVDIRVYHTDVQAITTVESRFAIHLISG